MLKGKSQTQSTEWPSAHTLSLNSVVLSQYFAVAFWLASDLHSFDAWMALFFTDRWNGIILEVVSARLKRSRSFCIGMGRWM